MLVIRPELTTRASNSRAWDYHCESESGTTQHRGHLCGYRGFFAVGGIAFGAIYVALVYLLPRPVDLLEFNVNAGLGFLVIVAVGSIASGFVTARTAERARVLHSAVAFVLLSALRRVYMLWGPDTFIWDDGDWGTIQLMVIASLPFFSLGTWLGSHKREQVEKSA